jgi:hypothetical protein
MAMAQINERKFQRLRQFIYTREDEPELWHRRAEHLGAEALKALVWAVQEVRIKGVKTIDCEACSKGKATQHIFRRNREHQAGRPFWRILWNLFLFERSFDDQHYAFVIKNEYSRKI